jgi:Fe-S cluster biogenesis protein NfuA
MKTPVMIYAEATPNPATMKFVANILLLPENSVEYLSKEDTEGSPLAGALFSFDFVRSVYINANFITLSKKEFISWSEIIPQVREFLKNWIEEGKDIVAFLPPKKEISTPKNVADIQTAGIEGQIMDILNEYVRPAVEGDGGEISFVSFNEGKVTVRLAGSCSGCPSSTVTLKNGIEHLLKKMVPGVEEVVAENA